MPGVKASSRSGATVRASDEANVALERTAVHPLLLEALEACEVDAPLGPGGMPQRVRLGDLTTRQVVAHAIQPWAQESGLSYVRALLSGKLVLPAHPLSKGAAAGSHHIVPDPVHVDYRSVHDDGEGHTLVSTQPAIFATQQAQQQQPPPVFFYVVHSWDSKFGDLVRVILQHYEGQVWAHMGSDDVAKFKPGSFYMKHKREEWWCRCQAPSFYFLDILAVPQAASGRHTEEHVEEVVQDVVADCAEVLLCAAPSLRQPTIMRRLWCLYEVMVAAELRKPLRFLAQELFEESTSPKTLQQAGALLEELEAAASSPAIGGSGVGPLQVELVSAETTLASDRDLLVRLIQRASPASPLPRWGVDSVAHAVVQARVRAALAEALLLSCLLQRSPAPAVWCARRQAEHEALLASREVATDVELFRHALSQHHHAPALGPAALDPPGALPPRGAHHGPHCHHYHHHQHGGHAQTAHRHGLGHPGRAAAPLLPSLPSPPAPRAHHPAHHASHRQHLHGAHTAPSSPAAHQLAAAAAGPGGGPGTSPGSGGTPAPSPRAACMSSDSGGPSQAAPAAPGGAKVLLEVPGHADEGTANLLREARLAQPLVAHLALRVNCHCAACDRLAAEHLAAANPSAYPGAPPSSSSRLPTTASSSGCAAGGKPAWASFVYPSLRPAAHATCTAAGFPIVALRMQHPPSGVSAESVVVGMAGGSRGQTPLAQFLAAANGGTPHSPMASRGGAPPALGLGAPGAVARVGSTVPQRYRTWSVGGNVGVPGFDHPSNAPVGGGTGDAPAGLGGGVGRLVTALSVGGGTLQQSLTRGLMAAAGAGLASGGQPPKSGLSLPSSMGRAGGQLAGSVMMLAPPSTETLLRRAGLRDRAQGAGREAGASIPVSGEDVGDAYEGVLGSGCRQAIGEHTTSSVGLGSAHAGLGSHRPLASGSNSMPQHHGCVLLNGSGSGNLTALLPGDGAHHAAPRPYRISGSGRLPSSSALPHPSATSNSYYSAPGFPGAASAGTSRFEHLLEAAEGAAIAGPGALLSFVTSAAPAGLLDAVHSGGSGGGMLDSVDLLQHSLRRSAVGAGLLGAMAAGGHGGAWRELSRLHVWPGAASSSSCSLLGGSGSGGMAGGHSFLLPHPPPGGRSGVAAGLAAHRGSSNGSLHATALGAGSGADAPDSPGLLGRPAGASSALSGLSADLACAGSAVSRRTSSAMKAQLADYMKVRQTTG